MKVIRAVDEFARSAMPVIGGNMPDKTKEGLDEGDLARFIFRKYCGSNQFIPYENVKFIFRDLYNSAHQYLEELDMDKATQEMFRILDMDKDGKISLRDIETLISSKGVDPNNTSLITKVNAIRQEKYMTKLDNMKTSFDSFNTVNYKLAKEIFNAYDTDGTGYIDKQDLPLVLIDTCSHLGLSTDLDRELLMTSIEAFNFRTKNKISQKEFEFLYTPTQSINRLPNRGLPTRSNSTCKPAPKRILYGRKRAHLPQALLCDHPTSFKTSPVQTPNPSGRTRRRKNAEKA